jgi:beta-glucosidase
MSAAAQTGPQALAPYKNAKLPINQRVADLLSRMTVEEKIRQLDMWWGHEVANMDGHESTSYNADKVKASIGNHGVGSIHDFYPLRAALTNQIQHYAIEQTRLGIPVLFIEEGLHGYSGKGSTEFPIPLQLASAFDTALVRQVGRVIGTETRAHGVDMILGPVLCLARDPRWGRAEETYGEDPFLDASNGVAMVKGLQAGDVSRPDAVISEPKHFATHGIPQGGSNTSPVNIGERENRTDYLYPFQKAVEAGGALGIMAAYSEIDGIPCVDNEWVLTDELRKAWGFKGFVLSDLGAIKMTLTDHGVARDTADALAQAIHAGLDMQFYDFGHETLVSAVKEALARKQLSMADLDRAAGDVLRVKYMLGLFDHPYTDTTLVAKVFHTQASQDLSLKAASEGIVLLKNEGAVLPLDGSKQSIAVIGPLAKSTYVGGYSSPSAEGISIWDALNQRLGVAAPGGGASSGQAGPRLAYERGYDPGDEGSRQEALIPDSVRATPAFKAAQAQNADSAAALMQRAVALLRNMDVGVVVLGEEPREVGEGKDRTELNLSPDAVALIEALQATGKPIAVVLFNGRPLSINWVGKHIPAILESWFGGEKGGLAIADVLLGRTNPSGKLPMTFPRSTGQLPYYYDHKPSSWHRYVDEQSTPLFPFGLGLSYTTFSYSGLTMSADSIGVHGSVDVAVTITNTGSRTGAEVAQCYIRDVYSSVTTPVKALKGFARVELAPGQSQTVHFRLDTEALAVWNRQMKHVVEPGEFRVMVGSSSEDIRAEKSFWVK